MSLGWTNRGKKRILDSFFRDQNTPTNLFVALVRVTNVPSHGTNVMSDLVEITAGNGYTAGGIMLNRDTTDFDTLTEDDVNDRALVAIKDLVWTASGGPIPLSGLGARYAVLTDDNVTVGSREVLAYWDLGSEQTRLDGQTLTLQDATLRAKDS